MSSLMCRIRTHRQNEPRLNHNRSAQSCFDDSRSNHLLAAPVHHIQQRSIILKQETPSKHLCDISILGDCWWGTFPSHLQPAVLRLAVRSLKLEKDAHHLH